MDRQCSRAPAMVCGTVAGIKKEYRFLRKVNGTTMLFYSLRDPQRQSPYADKLMMRFAGHKSPMTTERYQQTGIEELTGQR